jgi:DNA anti-recombination protein RmuC
MKKKILTLTITTVMVIAGSNAFGQQNKNDTTQTQKDLREAKIKAVEYWNQFKSESDSTIAVMEKQVKELREKIASENKKGKEKLNSDLNKVGQKINLQKEKLKKRNAEFEANLKKVDESVAAKNESFKREFKHDLEGISSTLKDLFKDNVK